MKYLKHSLLLLVLSGFLTGEIAAIESSLPPCPTKKGFFSGVSKWKHCYGSIEGVVTNTSGALTVLIG